MLLKTALTVAGHEELAKTAGAPADYGFEDKDSTLVAYVAAHLKLAGAPDMKLAEDYAKFWQINDICISAITKIAEYNKPRDLGNKDFALVAQYDGHVIRKYAAYDGPSVVEAASAFYDNKNRYPYEWRKTAATTLLAKSEKFGVVLPQHINTYLHKAAGFGVPTQESLEDAIVSRADVGCSQPELWNKIAGVVEDMIAVPALRYDDELVHGLIGQLEHFDVLTKAAGYMPEDIIADEAITSELVKSASYGAGFVRLMNGATVEASAIPKDVLEALDPALAKMAHAQLIEVLPTLPEPDATTLCRLLA